MVERIFVSPVGNVFMREIAEHLAEGLGLLGPRPAVVTDELPSGRDPYANLVVAPHEFFPLHEATPAERMAAAASSIGVNTEQPGTPFYDIALPFLAQGPACLDINPLAFADLRRRGFNAGHLALGIVPSMRLWDGGSTPRSVDVGLLAGRTERREHFLGGAASVLWELDCDLRFFSWHRPATAERGDFLSGNDKYRALADTRLLLNVHRDEVMYFEWARVLDAIANGCVVATEHSVGLGPLVPGEHLVMCGLDQLAERAVALLFDEQRRGEMARAALALADRELHQGRLAAVALDEVRVAAPQRRPNAAPSAVPHRVRQIAGRAQALLRPDDSALRETAEREAATLKRAWIGQLGVVRSLERAAAVARYGRADFADVVDSASYVTATPDVTVVIPLFHQGHFVAEALESVMAASGAGLHVDTIVVDDHSLDGSADVVRGYLAARPWQPVRLLARAANGGLPVARNVGFAAARAPMVFALDADNELRPNGLRVLAQALRAQPAEVVAAYGLLEKFDDHISAGVVSHLPWDAELLRWGNFIDAMVLWRKEAWAELGGYADDPGIYGWEDYDMWLAAADRGRRAHLVPRFVGRYREQAGSMRKVSDVDMQSNYEQLKLRHPRFPWH